MERRLVRLAGQPAAGPWSGGPPPGATRGRTATIGAALLAALALAAPGPPPARAGDLRVIDSQGREVGTFLSLSGGFADVLIPTPDSAVGLRLGRDGFIGAQPQITLFDTDDCTGSPRLLDPGGLPAQLKPPIATIGGLTPDGALVIPTPAAPALTMVESEWTPGAESPCDGTVSYLETTLATTIVADLAGLVPPFSLSGREPTGAPGRAGRNGPRIGVAVDGAGQLIGPLASLAPAPIAAAVVFEVEGRRAAVSMTGGGALLGTAFVTYAANNCTGPPFLVGSPGSSSLLLVGVDATGAVLRDDGPAAPLVLGSGWIPFLVPPCQVIPAGPPQPVRATALLENVAARPLPFSVRIADGGPAAPAADRPPARGLIVEDAAGATVGPAFVQGDVAPGDPAVLVRSGHRLGEVSLNGPRFGGGTRTARFEAAGCAGPVLVEAESPGDPVPLSPPSALGPGQLLHTADGPVDTANLQFYWDAGTATCLPAPLGPVFVRHTSVLSDLSRFTLPLRTR